MYRILLTIFIAVFIGGCTSKNVKLNSDSKCEPRWWNNQGKTFFWQKSYITDWKKGKVFGTGFERSFDRNTARRAAESLARTDILRQLKEKFEGEFSRIYDEDQNRAGVAQGAGSTKELDDKIISEVIGTCSMCFIIKFEDCYENGMWSAYALAEVAHTRQENDRMKKLLEASFLDENKEEKPEFEF
tara:strand:- start:242 stop:802 length:561 start_codon:yes stop_codon:yes gene_type:complete